MKYLIIFIAVILFSCSKKESNSSVVSPSNEYSHESHITRTAKKGLLVRDTAKVSRFQTFDEYTMSGKGIATHSPFVYVRKWNDSILVFSSNKNDSARLYIRKSATVWYSHMEYDMWKGRDYIPSKDGLSRPSRTYDRYFYNDTILELETKWFCGQRHQRLYVKNRKNLYIINNTVNVNSNDISELRRKIRDTLLSKKTKVQEYSLKESNDTYYYEGNNHNDRYVFDKKAYGLWGLQPGVEETFLYEGIDIREYSDNLEGFQRNNLNHIYNVVEIMPQFPGGFNGLRDYIRKNRTASLLANEEKPYRVVIVVIIEKDGGVTNPRIRKSIDSLHDEDALRIVREMPKWIPAKQNGKTVRCKMLIPISYKVSF